MIQLGVLICLFHCPEFSLDSGVPRQLDRRIEIALFSEHILYTGHFEIIILFKSLQQLCDVGFINPFSDKKTKT